MTNENEESEDAEIEELRELAEAPGTKEVIEAYGSRSGYSSIYTSVWFRDITPGDQSYSPYKR